MASYTAVFGTAYNNSEVTTKKETVVDELSRSDFMITALDVAAYFALQYQKTYHQRIDEMKLHKLLYFAQRESLLENNQPLFDDVFEAWKHGPVILSVRRAYKNEDLFSRELAAFTRDTFSILEYIFNTFAHIDSWDLSNMTHREVSWRNARKGILDGVNGNNPMLLEDIRKDANRRSCLLAQRGIAMLRKGEFDVRDFYK